MNTDLTPAPTPRSDVEEQANSARFKQINQEVYGMVPSGFARGLERELLAASKERDSAIEELVEAKQAWLDKSDAERGPYVAFETYDSVCRALREEQLKTQALTEALEEIHSEAVGALNNAIPEDAPEVVESLGVKAEIALKRFPSALAGEHPTRP